MAKAPRDVHTEGPSTPRSKGRGSPMWTLQDLGPLGRIVTVIVLGDAERGGGPHCPTCYERGCRVHCQVVDHWSARPCPCALLPGHRGCHWYAAAPPALGAVAVFRGLDPEAVAQARDVAATIESLSTPGWQR